MSEFKKNDNNFVGYEYKEVMVKRNMRSVYADGYNNFGWKLEGISVTIKNAGYITMKFKRDHKIYNKVELSRLQRQFDSCVSEIQELERSKVIGASAAAYVIGIIGTAFMAGSVFAYNANMLPLCVIFAIPGFIGWGIPYFCYCDICKKKTAKVLPLMDKKYDEVYEVCQKANGLLIK